ncbi:MAG: choline-sulfatase, partial [Sedimentisphaeraceae bacterium JB056]
REYIVSENNLHEGWAKPGKVNGRMVRSSRYKYVIYSNSEPAEQFFDIELDPGEVHDLSKKTQYAPLIQKHREMLREYMQETNDTFLA